ncbi:MAG: hypothetical protein R2857_11840 [Vampirovibrionales bacterium]
MIENHTIQQELAPQFARISERYANYLNLNKQYNEAIDAMKEGFRYYPSTDKLMTIGALYEQKQDIDSAIVWYSKLHKELIRKAFATSWWHCFCKRVRN